MATLQTHGRVAAMHRESTLSAADTSWRPLYTIGAYATALFIALSLGSFVTTLTGLPSGPSQTRLSLPAASETLAWISAHRAVFIFDELILLAPAFLTIVTFLALFVALKQVDPAWASIGSLLAIASLISSLTAVTAALGLVSISDQMALATTDAQRTALEGGATSLIVMYNVPTLSAVLWPAGIAGVSIAMLRGVFPRWMAYVGIATGAAGMVGEAAFPIVGWVFLVYGALILVWLVAVTWKLFGLGRLRPATQSGATEA